MPGIDRDKFLISKAQDTADLCEKQSCPKFLGFLSPAERIAIERGIALPTGVECFYSGGYGEAERTVFACYPDFFDRDDVVIPLSLLRATGRELGGLSHRDFLGSLLGLGIKREKIGDIVILEREALIFVSDDICGYILDNLKKVGRAGVTLEKADIYEGLVPEKKTEEIKGTCASLRIDGMIAFALGLSRGEAVSLIKSGKVNVNWEEPRDISTPLKEGDIFSVRGFGRYRFSGIDGMTRKNRYRVTVEKYL